VKIKLRAFFILGKYGDKCSALHPGSFTQEGGIAGACWTRGCLGLREFLDVGVTSKIPAPPGNQKQSAST